MPVTRPVYSQVKPVLLVLLALLVSACAQLPGPQPGPDSTELSLKEEQQLLELEEIGQNLFKKEVYAVHATEMLMAQIDSQDYPRFIGWLTLEFGGYVSVSFYQSGPFGISIIADVNYNSENQPSLILDPQRPITEDELGMLRAKNLALATGRNNCAERFNTVLLDSPDEKSWDVYVLATPTRGGEIVVGGHSMVRIDKASGGIVKYQPFSEHCLVLNKPEQSLPNDLQLQAMVMSYDLGDLPAPTYVYLGLLHRQKLIVDTQRGHWQIDAGHITRLEDY